MASTQQWSENERVGGHDCVDFVNTVEWRGRDQPRDGLRRYSDLLRWCRAVGLVSAVRAQRLRRLARLDPEAAEQVLERARDLREALHGLFLAWAAGERPAGSDVDVLNDTLARAPARQRVCWDGAYDWLHDEEETLETPLWQIAWSAADLLTSGERERLKRCADEWCGWLFYDGSRNRSRRWCSMSDCGNRAKVRRHYYRKRSGGSGEGEGSWRGRGR